jgi:hypothetical protein
MKWIGWAAAITLVISCFISWVYVPWIGFTATGMDAGPEFRSPAWAHIIFTFLFLIFSLVQRIWAKRTNLIVTALNLGWAVRNFLLITGCSGGDCPVKKTGIWLVLFTSVLMLLASMFPDMKLKAAEKTGSNNP